MEKDFVVKKDDDSSGHIVCIRDGDKVDGYVLTKNELFMFRTVIDKYVRELQNN